jgi:two-component system cell cycle response regulator DivK
MFNPLDTSTWDVLVADDEVDNLRIIIFVMEFSRIQVRTAANGKDCIEQIKRKMPSFVLMDIQMPEMSGWDALKAIRGDPAMSKLPVIALTAYAMTEDRERVMAAGFDGYIPKPITVPTFIQQVQDILKPKVEVARASEG